MDDVHSTQTRYCYGSHKAQLWLAMRFLIVLLDVYDAEKGGLLRVLNGTVGKATVSIREHAVSEQLSHMRKKGTKARNS
jgi:hypothetical protein